MKRINITCPVCGSKAYLRPASVVYGDKAPDPDAKYYVCGRYGTSFRSINGIVVFMYSSPSKLRIGNRNPTLDSFMVSFNPFEPENVNST